MTALETVTGSIGPYRLVEKIGEGGMGVVYLARDGRDSDPRGGREVAVKVLGPAVAADPTARTRLAREVDTMARVRSPFVAEILDASTGGTQPYIVTRYIQGRTLDATVKQDGPLSGAALQRLAAGLASALVAIHQAGVIHRDLKPANVILGDDGPPVLIDFGIAHVADATRVTKTGIVMGTPGYLAPEVIKGELAGPPADIHAWGATLAFAATGRQPYGTGEFQQIFFRVLHGQAQLDGVPPALYPLVAAALSTDPGQRPTARALAAQCGYLGTAAGAAPTLAAAPAVTLAGAGPFTAPPAPSQVAPDVADLLPPVGYPPAGSPPARPAPRPPAARPAADAPLPSGHGLLGLAFAVAAIALAIVAPVAGTIVALVAVTLLRAADRADAALSARRSSRGARAGDIVVVIVTAPLTVLRALLTTIVLAPLTLIIAAIAATVSVLAAHTTTLPDAGSWAAGAAVAWTLAGPGSRRPRRQFRRMARGVVRTRLAMGLALVVCWALSLAVVSSALTQPPLLWPAATWVLPHMPTLGSALHVVQQWLLHNGLHQAARS